MEVETICDVLPASDYFRRRENGISERSREEVKAGSCSRLLSLPPEVRLRIYHWVHLMNPIRYKEPISGYPVPLHCRYVLQPIRLEGNIENEITDPCHTPSRLLSPDRPFAGLPTALLRTCKKIYHEARTLPFATNEFVYPNWFSSGLYTAAAVTNAQRPWQRNAVRYVRLEVQAQDLRNPAALEKWTELCGHGSAWAEELRGLRLKIVERAGPDSGASTTDKDGLLDAAKGWAEGAGLTGMRKLERLEIELDKMVWERGQKLAWCEELQNVMRYMGSAVEIGCMERVL